MSQQDAAKQQANTRNNIRVVSIFTAAAIGLVGVLVILYAWQLPPFTRHSQFTDNAYVRGQTTFISPQVNGYITAVNVKDFAIVQPGEVLFQIDDRIYKQRVHQAQATLAMKEAALRNNLQQRKSAEATIAKNEAALQNARAQNLKIQADLKRIQQLTADGSLSIRERDSARASAAQGAADIEQAKAALEMSRQDRESTIVNRDSLEADVASAKAALELAQLLPSINLTATGSLQDRTLPDLLDNPLRLWSLGGSILAPLLNRQALNAQVDVSMAQRNQALYSYEKTVRSAFKEVNDSLDAISRYGEQLTELQEQETVAQETLRIAQNRYRNGYSSYLDVLDAQRTLFSTQLSVVQVKNNLLLAQIALYRALGGGWSDSSGS